jgi:translation initiation factor IF-1
MAETEGVLGVVEEALPNTLFRVKLEDGSLVLAYLAGKMRLHRIKVLVGDRVQLHIDPYGGERASPGDSKKFFKTYESKSIRKENLHALQTRPPTRLSFCCLLEPAP